MQCLVQRAGTKPARSLPLPRPAVQQPNKHGAPERPLVIIWDLPRPPHGVHGDLR